ncbi:MAG: Na+:solute symporter, partial [Bacteroidetes bacterium]|nr:Na+:solute symporter [Bacteroidota bacterium]
AAIKFGEIILGMKGWQTLLIAGSITLIYSALGGLKAVIITDLVQFIMAMIGSVWACIYLINLDQVGGLTALLENSLVMEKMSLLPDFSDPSIWVPILMVPLAVQWWASYYPGSEPGGGGYIAQRMLSAKDERNAMGATLLFNVAHYALRPWPWILIALASLVVFPQLSDIQTAFPNLPADKLGHDVAYPAMLTFLPSGLLGLVAAALIAAYMSTMSTQLNLGASYLVNDFYRRFIKPDASEKRLVWVARFFTVISMALGTALGLALKDATQVFNLLLLLGAGTGLIYILRWFWWRINAQTEIIAMISSLIIACYLTFVHDNMGFLPLEPWMKTVTGAVLTTLVWVISTYLTPPSDDKTLRNFYRLIKPAGPGWNMVIEKAALDNEPIEPISHKDELPLGILLMVIGSVTVYGALFASGNWIYGDFIPAIIFTIVTAIGSYVLFKTWNKIKTE